MSVMDRARLLVFIFVIISCAARCSSWDPNHVYVYDYAASMTTGRTAASGILRMDGQLSVRVIDATSLIFKLNRVNISGSQDAGAEWQQATSLQSQLQTEFHVSLKNETVQSLAHLASASQWAVSVHKGIASLFSLRFPERKDGHIMSNSATYTWMEEEVTGRCANVYDWSPLDGVRNSADDAHLCHPTTHSRYQLFKTRNFDNCTHLPIYNLLAPAAWRCRPGSAICENVQSRSLVERVELCGSGRKLDIMHVELREDWISQTWGAKHEKGASRRVSITQRVALTAKDQSPREEKTSADDELLDPLRYQQQSLVYAFGQPEVAQLVMLDEEEAMGQFLEEIKELRSIAFQPTELVKRRGSSLRRRLLDRFESLTRIQLASLTERARRQLTPPQWSFYVQQMAMTGSAATLDMAKELMERQQISNEDMMSLISGWSMFLREPSDHVLGQLLSLMDLEVVRSEPDLRQTTMVSLASFFRLASIDRLSAEARFPSQYYNVSEGEAWPRRLVARLAVEIRQGGSGDRSAALSALNILGHRSLIPVIIPLIEGKADSNPAVRTKAVLALHKLAHHGDEEAIKILHMVYANPSDNYQVRLAAFTLLILSCPPDHVWQSVAARTWFEPRSHVASFVYTTFDTLANFRSPLRFLQKLSLKAKKVLKLTKPVTRGRSANYIWSYEKRQRLLASYLRLETFASKASVFPKEIYGRLNFNLGAVDFDFLEFEIHGHRMESILSLILGHDEPQHWSRCHVSRRSLSAVDILMARLDVVRPAPPQLGEGFFHWTVMESIEKFWSFDGAAAKSIQGYLADTEEPLPATAKHVEWLHELPLVNVDIRWANSMGFLTRVRVTGQITATLDGSLRYSRKPMAIESDVNPTLALQVESSVGVQLGGCGRVFGPTSSSSILLLASLPGRLSARLTERPINAIQVKWNADDRNEFILLHKSHCVDDACPWKSSQAEMIEDDEWLKVLLGGGRGNWEKLLSAVSFSWLPDENMGIGWRQLSWRKSIHPTAFQFSVQLNRTQHPVEWIMASGTTDLRQTSLMGESEGVMRSEMQLREVTGEASEGDPAADLVRVAEQVEAKPIGLSAAAAGSSSAWLELPTQIGRTLLQIASGQQLQGKDGRERNDRDHLTIRWSAGGDDNVSNTTGAHAFPMEVDRADYTGECRVGRHQVTTFDGVVYDPRFGDGCQYMVVAVTDTDHKLAILLDRQSPARNQAIRLVLSDDNIEIDLAEKKLSVNQVPIPLLDDSQPGRAVGFSLASPCHGSLLGARFRDNDTLEIELPFHGMMLDIHSDGDISIKARESLGGQVQGLCGDMNGERLFEFRGPRRCVLSSGSLMAAQYETSDHPHCFAPDSSSSSDYDAVQQQQPPASDDRISPHHLEYNCPRQEGSPTLIKMPFNSHDHV